MSVRSDIEAMHSFGLLVWRGLTDAQRSALRRAGPAYGCELAARGHGRALQALHAHGLTASPEAPAPLTPTGRLVRELGVEADAAAAKRRYSRRGRASS